MHKHTLHNLYNTLNAKVETFVKKHTNRHICSEKHYYEGLKLYRGIVFRNMRLAEVATIDFKKQPCKLFAYIFFALDES